MTTTDAVLREGKEVTGSGRDHAESLEDYGLCSITVDRYLKCAHREDGDYDKIPNPSCPGVCIVEPDQQRYHCPECGRTMYKSEKRVFESAELSIDHQGIRDYVRGLLNGELDVDSNTIDNGRTYGGFSIDLVLEGSYEGSSVYVPILGQAYSKELVEWMRIFDDPVLCVLFDNALDLRPWLDENDVQYVTVGNLVDDEPDGNVELLERELEKLVSHSDLYSLDRRANLSFDYCKSRRHLERMGWREFEHCTNNLLLYSIGTSSLLGGTEPGTGVPDGAFTLHGGDQPSLFMWDAKFVNLASKKETELRGEYDKIFRHLAEMQSQPPIEAQFGNIEGIILFSPGVKSANVVRLNEVIREYDLLTSTDWSGTVAHFTLDALCRLYEGVRNNDGGMDHKPKTFHSVLHRYLTMPSRHDADSEPTPISESKSSIHMSKDDINSVFNIVSGQPKEQTRFDREAYQELRLVLFDL